jgi:hypothetical protein
MMTITGGFRANLRILVDLAMSQIKLPYYRLCQ